MFKIVTAPNDPDDYAIYFNDEFIIKARFNIKTNIIEHDEFVKFDLELLRNYRLKEYPDNFLFKFETPNPYLEHFDLFTVKKTENAIIIDIWGAYDIYSDFDNRLLNFIWSPKHFTYHANRIAEKKGFEISKYAYKEDEEFYSFSMVFYFPINEDKTLGNLFDIVFKETAAVLYEAEMVLFNEAAKRLGKK